MKLAQENAENGEASEELDISSLKEELSSKRQAVAEMNDRLQKIKEDLDAVEARRIQLQHHREHLKEQSEMFRFMTEEIDRSFAELLDREATLRAQKMKLEQESTKLHAQVERVGKYVASIQDDIGAVHVAMEEFARKKSVFALELKEALEDDKQGKERLRGLRRQSLEAKR